MAKRGEKVRCANQWTEAKYWSHIRNSLRSGFLRYPVRGQVKKQSHEGPNQYRCAGCDKLYGTKEVHVDHIIPCGKLTAYEHLAGFVERLFCEPDNLQVLCTECHKAKTKQDREDIRNG